MSVSKYGMLWLVACTVQVPSCVKSSEFQKRSKSFLDSLFLLPLIIPSIFLTIHLASYLMGKLYNFALLFLLASARQKPVDNRAEFSHFHFHFHSLLFLFASLPFVLLCSALLWMHPKGTTILWKIIASKTLCWQIWDLEYFWMDAPKGHDHFVENNS